MKKTLIIIVCICAISVFAGPQTFRCYPNGDVDAGSYKALHKIFVRGDNFEYYVVAEADHPFSVAAGGSASWSLRKITGAGVTLPAVSGKVNGKATFAYYARIIAKYAKETLEKFQPTLKLF